MQCQSRSAVVDVFIVLRRYVWVYDDICRWERISGQMMVHDDHEAILLPELGNFVHSRDAVIYRDDKGSGRNGVDDVLGETISLRHPLRDNGLRIGPVVIHDFLEDSRSVQAIGIVVANNGDWRVRIDSVDQSIRCFQHILRIARVLHGAVLQFSCGESDRSRDGFFDSIVLSFLLPSIHKENSF